MKCKKTLEGLVEYFRTHVPKDCKHTIYDNFILKLKESPEYVEAFKDDEFFKKVHKYLIWSGYKEKEIFETEERVSNDLQGLRMYPHWMYGNEISEQELEDGFLIFSREELCDRFGKGDTDFFEEEQFTWEPVELLFGDDMSWMGDYWKGDEANELLASRRDSFQPAKRYNHDRARELSFNVGRIFE